MNASRDSRLLSRVDQTRRDGGATISTRAATLHCSDRARLRIAMLSVWLRRAPVAGLLAADGTSVCSARPRLRSDCHPSRSAVTYNVAQSCALLTTGMFFFLFALSSLSSLAAVRCLASQRRPTAVSASRRPKRAKAHSVTWIWTARNTKCDGTERPNVDVGPRKPKRLAMSRIASNIPPHCLHWHL